MLLHMGCHSCSTPCKRETDLERERVKREPSADQLEGGDNVQLEGGDNVQLGGENESPPSNRVVHFRLSLPLLPHVCQVSQVPSLNEFFLFHLEKAMYYYLHDMLF